MHFIEKLRTNEYDEEIAMVVAQALAKSRGMTSPFPDAWTPGSLYDQIYTEACRVVAALRKMSN